MDFVFNVFPFLGFILLFVHISENTSLEFNGDSVMDSIGSILDTVAELADDKERCEFKCPNGVKPQRKEGHRPTSNGCGSLGIQLDTSKLPEMTKCCNEHDLCYDTCNNEKQKCDKKFRKCIEKMCDKMEDTLEEHEYEGCQATAQLMYQGTAMLGCSSYVDAQSGACDCFGKKQQKSKKSRQTGEL